MLETIGIVVGIVAASFFVTRRCIQGFMWGWSTWKTRRSRNRQHLPAPDINTVFDELDRQDEEVASEIHRFELIREEIRRQKAQIRDTALRRASAAPENSPQEES